MAVETPGSEEAQKSDAERQHHAVCARARTGAAGHVPQGEVW